MLKEECLLLKAVFARIRGGVSGGRQVLPKECLIAVKDGEEN